jgi:endonuclease YncB( thermonuclease family)
MVSEGLVTVRREGVRQSPELTRLIELEDAAKSAGKGKWGFSPPSVSSLCGFFLAKKLEILLNFF